MGDIDGKNPNIIVTVRVRPETQEEANSQLYRSTVRCLDEKVVIFDPADPNKPSGRGAPNNHGRSKDLKFGFDRVFDQYSTQHEVYQHTTKTLIGEVLNGFNCTCFAYGATGAGKTFTMIGNKENPGVMVLTMKELFSAMEEQADKVYDVNISYLEIYNETIRDLLVKNSKLLDLRESADAGVQVAGLSSYKPTSADEVLQMLEVGNSRRCQSATGANAQSSRSHAVLQICVEQRDRTASVSTEVKTGKLSLIDLAGSERASRTKTRGQQLVEGANINKSLLALGNCINALGQDYKEGKYVPYRNSKLTRLLKDSLGGNCKTVMIANVSPSSISYEDTYNTLNYANRAKNIKTKVHTNQINVKVHVSQYKNLIDQLRAEIDELKAKLRDVEKNGRTTGQDMKERSQIEEMRLEIGRSVQDRQTVEFNLKQLQTRERELLELREAATLKIEDWQVRKWEKMQGTRVSGALGAALDLKPPPSPFEIHQARKKIQESHSEEDELRATKETLLKRLERNVEETKRIHQQVPTRVSSDLGRRQLERDLSIHWLELEKLNRDIEIARQKATVSAMQQQLAKAFQLLEVQNQLLEENGLLTPGVQERYDALMWTPSRTKKRTPGSVLSTRDPPSPFMKNYSPIAIAHEISDKDLPGLVQLTDCEVEPDPSADLSSRFSNEACEKENRHSQALETNNMGSIPKAAKSKPFVPARAAAPASRFGFAASTTSRTQATAQQSRKTPTKTLKLSLLHLHRRPEDKYPSSYNTLARAQAAPSAPATKTPVKNARPARWTPVSGKKTAKSVRFAVEEPSDAGTPSKTPSKSTFRFPSIPTATSISSGKEFTPSKAEPALPAIERDNPTTTTVVAPVPEPSSSVMPFESPSKDCFEIPEPPPNLARLVQLIGAVNN